jgi:putative nucleotidyltransferase with HDIG domain
MNVASGAGARLADQAEQIIVKRLGTDTLMLPAMPAVATRCMALLKNPEFATKAVVTLLEQDPVLSARLLRVANSAAFGGAGGGISTITAAVSRLGSQRLKNLIVETIARQLYESRDKRIAASCRAIWEHSVAVALLARDLAAFCNEANAMDVAYLGGLLHDVGKLVVASILLEAEKLASARLTNRWIESEEWTEAVNRSHRKVGTALADKWALPPEIVAAIRDCGDYDSTNRASPANFVRFANALAKRERIYLGPVDAGDNDALIMIGRSLLGVDDDLIRKVCAGIGDRIKTQTT